MAEQYHFQFPSEQAARRFVHLIAWDHEDVALMRFGTWVSVIDGGANGRDQIFLTLALRISDEDATLIVSRPER